MNNRWRLLRKLKKQKLIVEMREVIWSNAEFKNARYFASTMEIVRQNSILVNRIALLEKGYVSMLQAFDTYKKKVKEAFADEF